MVFLHRHRFFLKNFYGVICSGNLKIVSIFALFCYQLIILCAFSFILEFCGHVGGEDREKYHSGGRQ